MNSSINIRLLKRKRKKETRKKNAGEDEGEKERHFKTPKGKRQIFSMK